MTIDRATRRYSAYVFDLDGTLYVDDHLTHGAAATLAWVRAIGARVAFLTNNPLRRGATYAAKLAAAGHRLRAGRGGHLARRTHELPRPRATRRAGACSSPSRSWVEVLVEARLASTRSPEDAAMVVVSGIGASTTPKLLAAFRAVRNGARIVATNPDPYLPRPPTAACPTVPRCSRPSRPAPAHAPKPIVGKPSRHMATHDPAPHRRPCHEDA